MVLRQIVGQHKMLTSRDSFVAVGLDNMTASMLFGVLLSGKIVSVCCYYSTSKENNYC